MSEEKNQAVLSFLHSSIQKQIYKLIISTLFINSYGEKIYITDSISIQKFIQVKKTDQQLKTYYILRDCYFHKIFLGKPV